MNLKRLSEAKVISGLKKKLPHVKGYQRNNLNMVIAYLEKKHLNSSPKNKNQI